MQDFSDIRLENHIAEGYVAKGYVEEGKIAARLGDGIEPQHLPLVEKAVRYLRNLP